MKKKEDGKITVVIDTREQAPLALAQYGFEIVNGCLPFGDYTVRVPDLETSLVIERKSLADFAMCCGRERDRFEKELIAMRGYRYRYIVGEFGLRDVLGKAYRSQISPNSLLASIAKWSGCYGIHFLFCDTPAGAAYIVARMIYFICRMETKNSIEIARPAWLSSEEEKVEFQRERKYE